MSTPAFARTTPVTPPTVNRKMKPIAHSIGVLNSIEPPHIVAIQEKILIPVGTAMSIDAAAKYARVSIEIPVMHMWCAQTAQPLIPWRKDCCPVRIAASIASA
jgi:hypothetical protein